MPDSVLLVSPAGVLGNVQAQTTSCTSPITQAAAEGALTGLQRHRGGLAADDREQPQRDDAGAAILHRRE
jgi:putative effector of murein hydrolase